MHNIDYRYWQPNKRLSVKSHVGESIWDIVGTALIVLNSEANQTNKMIDELHHEYKESSFEAAYDVVVSL